MKIVTDSIIDTLEIVCNKNIDEIKNEDLFKIESLNISKFGIDDQILNTNFNELNYFLNLKKLSIVGCNITNDEINIINNLNNLEYLSFINCDFEGTCNCFKSISVDNLVLNNTNNFPFKYLNDLKYLKVFDMEYFYNNNKINTLDLFNSKFNIDILYSLTIDELIISESDYKSNKDIYNNLNYKVTIKEDNGEFEYKESNND